MSTPGTLFIVATPIGNLRDITLRALDILASVDAVICEETREGSTLLKKLGIAPKALVTLNEHNEAENVMDLVVRLSTGESFALISDCGTPGFADPGALLVEQASSLGIPVTPVPGVSSLSAALSILDFKLEKFVFGGFLPRDPAQRRQELTRLRALRMPVVLMDTPYRLTSILEEVGKTFGKGAHITLAADLTLPGERIYRGSVSEVLHATNGRKAEFILIIH